LSFAFPARFVTQQLRARSRGLPAFEIPVSISL
jgi:hypothetical protein